MHYDVAIIGAGPAGLVVASLLQRSGVRLIVIDRHSENTTVCARAETIGASTLGHLSDLGLSPNAFVSRIVEAKKSIWGGDLWSDSGIGNGRHVIVERNVFDCALRNQVAAAGVDIIRGKVTGATLSTSPVRLDLADGNRVDAAFVVDASGRVAQWSGQQALHRVTFDTLVSISLVFSPRRDAAAEFAIEALPDGWALALVDATGREHVSFFVDHDSIPSGVQLLSFFRHRLSVSKLFKDYVDAKHIQPLRYWTAATSILQRCFSTRLIAVGDAAQTRDPLSGGGIAAAIGNASSAAEALLRFLGGDSQALLKHERSRRDEFAKYLLMKSGYYACERRWPDAAFWSRRSTASLA
jgi:flavin-dependent dehydrogenase